MPDIGNSLREARMRAQIDITEAEADTKIRGKYLRALENEEWALLPGPTFVRSFLRTYGDYLGLDGRLLVEDFRVRFEQLEGEPQPISPQSRRAQERKRQGAGSPVGSGRGRALIAAGLIAVLLAGLFALGRNSSDEKPVETTPVAPAGAGVATLMIRPSATLYACLRAADGRRLVDGVLQPGRPDKEYRSRRLRLTLGSGDAQLVVNGETRTIAAGSRPVGYEITSSGMRRLDEKSRPRCS